MLLSAGQQKRESLNAFGDVSCCFSYLFLVKLHFKSIEGDFVLQTCHAKAWGVEGLILRVMVSAFSGCQCLPIKPGSGKASTIVDEEDTSLLLKVLAHSDQTNGTSTSTSDFA